jgi:hypothetical protein
MAPLENPISFEQFAKENLRFFPAINQTYPYSVKTEDRELAINDSKLKITITYLQVLIPDSLENMQAILENPKLFRAMFGLNSTAHIQPKNNDGSFIARIHKKLPIVPDQDYTLLYKSKLIDSYWVQRVTQVNDAHNFAFRDHLKIMKKSDQGVLYREIAIMFSDKWYVRTMRKTLKKTLVNEYQKIARLYIQLALSPKPISQETAAHCFKKAEKPKK